MKLKLKSSIFMFLVLGLSALAVAGIYWLQVYRFPYGDRGCAIICLGHSLRAYAAEHGGRYPTNATSGLLALQQLYPIYADEYQLAGLSGDRARARSRLKSGLPLDEESCSIVYVQGYNLSSNSEALLLWEREPGLLANACRGPMNLRAALRVSGGLVYVDVAARGDLPRR